MEDITITITDGADLLAKSWKLPMSKAELSFITEEIDILLDPIRSNLHTNAPQ